MTGWSVEVGPDIGWYQQRDLVPPDGDRTQIEVFARDSLWQIGERWCVLVDWGERAVRWIPPGEKDSRPIDLSFRPQSYLSPRTGEVELLSHIKGASTRAAVRRLLDVGVRTKSLTYFPTRDCQRRSVPRSAEFAPN